jgi:hypothetical protein
MDFRDPNTVGTFVYHCHLLDHEDGGMMALVRVEPPTAAVPGGAAAPPPGAAANAGTAPRERN